MTEGTRLGESNTEERTYNQVYQDNAEDFQATKIGDLSGFDNDLVEQIQEDEAVDVAAEPKAGTDNEATPDSTKDAPDVDINEDVNFEEVMASELVDYQEGDEVKGIVRRIERGGVLVDIKYKSDGFISNEDFTLDPNVSPADEVAPGDEIVACIERLESKEGYTILSRKQALYEQIWTELTDSVSDRNILSVKVISNVLGGLVVEFKSIRGFIPASQVSRQKDEKLDQFVGQVLDVIALQVDRRKKKIVFSNRMANSSGKGRQKNTEIFEKIEIGEIREGKVTSIKDFGVFVDIGGVEGLVHISELSWSRVRHPSDFVGMGDEVKVFVLGVDQANQRISLGMKQLKKDPWVDAVDKYKIGQVIKGKVSRLVSFGAFLEIEEGLEGLIHISELSHERVENVSDVLKEEDEVDVTIIKLIPEEQRIGLSIKQLTRNHEEYTSEAETEQDASQVEGVSDAAAQADDSIEDVQGSNAEEESVVTEDNTIAEESVDTAGEISSDDLSQHTQEERVESEEASDEVIHSEDATAVSSS